MHRLTQKHAPTNIYYIYTIHTHSEQMVATVEHSTRSAVLNKLAMCRFAVSELTKTTTKMSAK